jgi:ABC-type oligopeptide transport system ATPase subunit
MSNIVSVKNLTRVFDVSKPWLNRVIERLPKRQLTAVSDASFEIPAGTTYALVGES